MAAVGKKVAIEEVRSRDYSKMIRPTRLCKLVWLTRNPSAPPIETAISHSIFELQA